MAETGININGVALHFDIQKTTAFRIIYRFRQTRLAGDLPRSDSQKKTNSTGGTFHPYHIKTG